MIVVIGSPVGRKGPAGIVAAGDAARVAVGIAARGTSVQLVGRVGDDPAADAILQDLGRAGVGHVAILRDASHATPIAEGADEAPPAIPIDGQDVDLAMRYLSDFDAIVVIQPVAADVLAAATSAADWGEARLIVGGPPDATAMGDLLEAALRSVR